MVADKRDQDSPHFAICGGGVGGLALATLLASSGAKVALYEARPEAMATSEGAFLTLAPNGQAALRAIGVQAKIRSAGLATLALDLHNHRGRLIASVDQRGAPDDGSVPSVTIARGVLVGILIDAARSAGAHLHFEQRLTTVEQERDRVLLAFDNGPSDHAFDFLVGADGLRSLVRQTLFSDARRPTYTGLIGTGGFVEVPAVAPTNGRMRMTFGQRAFFGYMKEGDGPVFWFNSYPSKTPDAGSRLAPSEYAQELRAMHARDPGPIPQILDAVPSIDRDYPIYDMPLLERWHTDRIVLIGDAAHAVSPHAGQGASMALEDAVVIAACLAKEGGGSSAFRRFESLRLARARHVMEVSRRTGNQKLATNWLARVLRDLMLPIFIPQAAEAQRRIAAFRVDVDPLCCRDQQDPASA